MMDSIAQLSFLCSLILTLYLALLGFGEIVAFASKPTALIVIKSLSDSIVCPACALFRCQTGLLNIVRQMQNCLVPSLMLNLAFLSLGRYTQLGSSVEELSCQKSKCRPRTGKPFAKKKSILL